MPTQAQQSRRAVPTPAAAPAPQPPRVVYASDAARDAAEFEALLAKIVQRDRPAAPYRAGGNGAGGVTIDIESLTAANVGTAPDYYRHMVGWNRKALRISMRIDAAWLAAAGGEAAGLRALTPLLELSARGTS